MATAAVGEVEKPVDWAKFVPTKEVPVEDAKSLSCGEVWAFHRGLKEWGVVEVTHDTTKARPLCVSPDIDVFGDGAWIYFSGSSRARSARLVRHADGRWADGYGPDGPVANRPARTVPSLPCRSSKDINPARVKRFRWARGVSTTDHVYVRGYDANTVFDNTAGSIGMGRFQSGDADILEWMPGCDPEGPAESRKSGTGERALATGWKRDDCRGWMCAYGEHVPYAVERPGCRVPAVYVGPNLSGACEACAEAAGVYADSPAKTAPVESPASKPAEPSACTWVCSPDDDIHGPRCPKFVPSRFFARPILADLAARQTIVGEYGPNRNETSFPGVAKLPDRGRSRNHIEHDNARLRPRWTSERNAAVVIQDANDPDFCLAVDR